MTISQQLKLIQLLNNLFKSGFHLAEIVAFLERSSLVEKSFTEQMRAGLQAGKNLAGIMEELRFSKNVITQIALTELHGGLSETLELIEENLSQQFKVRRKLIAVLTYPLILLGFLIFIMLAMKNYLIPQIEAEGNATLSLVNHLPELFLLTLFILVIALAVVYFYFKGKPILQSYQALARLPIIGNYIRLYLTAYFAREWGNLIAQGLSMQEVLEMMKGQKSPIFRALGGALQQEMRGGKSFAASLTGKKFLKKELGLIIEYGEVKGKLGRELIVYAGESWEQFFAKIHQSLQWIQPLVFSFVALMIVLLYAAMLLPIYSSFEQLY